MPLATFGCGNGGVLGHDDSHSTLSQPTMLPHPTTVVSAALGGVHSVALTAEGHVWCWGQTDLCAVDTSARLGRSRGIQRPLRVTALRKKVVAHVGAGGIYTLVATAGSCSELWLWGTQHDAQVDRPLSVANPPRMPTCLWRAGKRVQALSCGALHTVLLLGDGTAHTVGESCRGGLGQGEDVLESPLPAPMVHGDRAADGPPIVSVAAGAGHTIVVDADGNAYSCGDNRYGQLGVGDRENRFVPTALAPKWHPVEGVPCVELEPEPAPDSDLELLSIRRSWCGDYHTVLLATDDHVYTCGRGCCGQLGHTGNADEVFPRDLPLPSNFRLVAAAAGGGLGSSHTLLLLQADVPSAQQKLLGFGSTSNGQLGPMDPEVMVKTASLGVSVPLAAMCKDGTSAIGVAAGWLHSAIILSPPDSGSTLVSTTSSIPSEGLFGDVSNEVILRIMAQCDALELCRWAIVSSLFRELAGADELWQPLYLARFGDRRAQRAADTIDKEIAVAGWKHSFAEASLEYLHRHDGFGSVPITGSHTSARQGIGGTLARLVGRASKPHNRCLMFGLDSSGKTSVMYRLKLGEMVVTIPTPGFNVEIIERGGRELTVWDVGYKTPGNPGRRLWNHYYANTDAIIFVVDCGGTYPYHNTHEDHWTEAQAELARHLAEPEMADAVLLVMANKQDIDGAMSVAEVVDVLQLEDLAMARRWYVQPCSARLNHGLEEGMQWLCEQFAR